MGWIRISTFYVLSISLVTYYFVVVEYVFKCTRIVHSYTRICCVYKFYPLLCIDGSHITESRWCVQYALREIQHDVEIIRSTMKITTCNSI